MDVVAHCTRDTYAAGRAFRLEPGRNIHATAVDVGTLRYDVADVDADTEPDGPVRRLVAIEQGDLLLNCDGTAHRSVDAVEHDQQRVPGGLGNSAAMLADGRINQFSPKSLQSGNRSRVIKSYEAAVTDYVGIDDSDQPPAAGGLAGEVGTNADGAHGPQSSAPVGAADKRAVAYNFVRIGRQLAPDRLNSNFHNGSSAGVRQRGRECPLWPANCRKPPFSFRPTPTILDCAHASPSANPADVSEADMLARETSDADWVETCRSFACHIRDIGSIIRPFRHRDARDEHTPRNASDTLLIHRLLWR
jgi:hypothetical protein